MPATVLTSDDQVLRTRDLNAIFQAMEALGMDLRAMDLNPRPELDPLLLFPLAMTKIATYTRDPTVMLSIGEAVPFGAYEIIDYLAASAADVGKGLHKLVRYFALITPTLIWAIDDSDYPVRITLESKRPFDEGNAAVQYSLGVTLARFANVADGDFKMSRVELKMPPPRDTSRHDAFFACPVRYDADINAVYLPSSTWHLPLKRAEPGLHSVLESHAEALLAEADIQQHPLTPIRTAIAGRLSDGQLKLDDVARELAMSARTLQRRLRELDTTFNTQVDHVRQAAARSYLGDARLAIGEVAYMLGYSEQSAFVRAFKRWTGKTPREFRA